MKRKLTTLLLALLAMVPALADDLSLGYCDGQQVDEYAFNNTLSAPLRVLSEIVRRKVLVEEFTGQQCSNCPAGRTNIEEGMKDEDHYVMIAHHTGYGTDALTAPALFSAASTACSDAPPTSEICASMLDSDRYSLSACSAERSANSENTEASSETFPETLPVPAEIRLNAASISSDIPAAAPPVRSAA